MNWNWACEQMLAGKRVRMSRWHDDCFICLDTMGDSDGDIIDNNNPNSLACIDRKCLTATDWELYQEPKLWTEEQREFAKALITLGGEYIACDVIDRVYVYSCLPIRGDGVYISQDGNGECRILGRTLTSMFSHNIHWEDEEPTRLQDIVDSEVQDD